MKKMKLSTLIEVLLILIIIAFAASKPVDTENRAIKNVRKNTALPKQQSAVAPVATDIATVAVAPVVSAVEAAPAVAAVTPPDDDDVDDLLGLVVGEDDDDDEEEEEPVEADDDDDDLFGLGGDDADDDEPEGLAAGAAEGTDTDADTDDGAFALFGGDLFDALFEDDTTTKKPKVKPSAVVASVEAAPIEAAVAAASVAAAVNAASAPAKKVLSNLQQNKIATRKVVPVKSISPPASEKNTLNFQHTPALLQLSQSSIKSDHKPTEDTIIVGLEPGQHVPGKVIVIQVPESTKKDEENAVNQVTEQLMETNEIPSEKVTIEHVAEFNPDSDESSDEDNMIIISSSSDNKDLNQDFNADKDAQDEEIIENDDALEVAEDLVDKVQEAVPDALVEVSTAAVVKKKPAKEEEGLLSTIVTSLIDDDDDDDVKGDVTKDEATASEEDVDDTTSDEEDDEDEKEVAEKEPVEIEKDDEDEDDDDEDDDEDDDDDDIDKKKDKVPHTETKPEKGNKTKKKKDDISFASIGETLGLSRIFRAKAE